MPSENQCIENRQEKVYGNYPTYDLTERKDFIKTANVKELIS